MIEIITENLAAGELKTFMMQGEYVEILDAQYPLDVFMMDRSGGQISTMRKAEASFFSRPGRFECVQLQSANAQTVRIFIGSGDAGTRRTSGVVSVIDGEGKRTLAGGMFAGSPSVTAANNPQVQLWNPNSGKNLIVTQVSVAANVAGGWQVSFSPTALATDQSATRAANKLKGGPAAAGQVRVADVVGIPAGVIYGGFIAANAMAPWPIKGAIVLPPLAGLIVAFGAVGSSGQANFEWYEETI